MVGIAIDPINPNKVYISTNAINEPGVSVLGRVFRTMNGGISWADISGDLPNIPLISIAVARDHSLKNPLIFVGGDPGVFVSNERQNQIGQVHWTKYGQLPEVTIMDIEIRPQGQIITVGTWGRGVYDAVISGPEIPNLNAPHLMTPIIR